MQQETDSLLAVEARTPLFSVVAPVEVLFSRGLGRGVAARSNAGRWEGEGSHFKSRMFLFHFNPLQSTSIKALLT